MNELAGMISREIQESGPMPFSRFMQLCLYHPEYGYYRRQALPIGKSGDYYTSPCVHRIFGHILGRQIHEVLSRINEEDMCLIEAGAGRGHLARDIGEYFSLRQPDILTKIRLIIIEPHHAFREIQRREVQQFFPKTDFVDHPDNLPQCAGVFYSNELFDSFPVEILVNRDGKLQQGYVGYCENGFVEQYRDISPAVKAHLERFSLAIPDEFRTEVAPSVSDFYGCILKKITKGAVITVDYGYSAAEYLSPARNRGTLMGYYRHQAVEDPYIRAGEQDLTSHVNFSVMKKTGEELGWTTAGYTEQQYFLMGAGFIEEVERLRQSVSFEEYENEIRKIKTLVLPGGMGTIFKVFVQSRGVEPVNFSCFSFRNEARIL